MWNEICAQWYDMTATQDKTRSLDLSEWKIIKYYVLCKKIEDISLNWRSRSIYPCWIGCHSLSCMSHRLVIYDRHDEPSTHMSRVQMVFSLKKISYLIFIAYAYVVCMLYQPKMLFFQHLFRLKSNTNTYNNTRGMLLDLSQRWKVPPFDQNSFIILFPLISSLLHPFPRTAMTVEWEREKWWLPTSFVLVLG